MLDLRTEELSPEATRKERLQVRTEGSRRVRRKFKIYNLDAILAVGCRVRSPRGEPRHIPTGDDVRPSVVKAALAVVRSGTVQSTVLDLMTSAVVIDSGSMGSVVLSEGLLLPENPGASAQARGNRPTVSVACNRYSGHAMFRPAPPRDSLRRSPRLDSHHIHPPPRPPRTRPVRRRDGPRPHPALAGRGSRHRQRPRRVLPSPTRLRGRRRPGGRSWRSSGTANSTAPSLTKSRGPISGSAASTRPTTSPRS